MNLDEQLYYYHKLIIFFFIFINEWNKKESEQIYKHIVFNLISKTLLNLC